MQYPNGFIKWTEKYFHFKQSTIFSFKGIRVFPLTDVVRVRGLNEKGNGKRVFDEYFCFEGGKWPLSKIQGENYQYDIIYVGK